MGGHGKCMRKCACGTGFHRAKRDALPTFDRVPEQIDACSTRQKIGARGRGLLACLGFRWRDRNLRSASRQNLVVPYLKGQRIRIPAHAKGARSCARRPAQPTAESTILDNATLATRNNGAGTTI